MPVGRLRPFGGWSEGFGTLDALRREMDRIFTEYSGGRAARTAGVYPAMNVFEDHEKFEVQAEIAGIEPSELNVSVVQNTLSVSGERKIAKEGGDASYHRRERAGGVPSQYRAAHSGGERQGRCQLHRWDPDHHSPEGGGGATATDRRALT